MTGCTNSDHPGHDCGRKSALLVRSCLSFHELTLEGINEAIAEMKQAQALDPLSPLINANAGWTLYLAREHDAAIDELKRTIELDPHFGIAHLYIGFPYIQQERYEQALAAFQKATEVTPGMPWAAEMIGYIYGLSSERGKAKKSFTIGGADEEAQICALISSGVDLFWD